MRATSRKFRRLKWAAGAAMVATLLLLIASMPTTLQADVPQVDASRGESNATCPPDMVYVPAASVRLGSAVSGARSVASPPNPPHVAVVRAFCIDRLEVSVAIYNSCSWCGRSAMADAGICRYGSDQLPVRCIRQQDAEQYCSSHGRHLPSSDQWEYAARGTDQRMYPWGNPAPPTAFVLAREIGTDPHDVSPFGIADMGGNVGEWVSDQAQLPLGGPCGVVRGSLPQTRFFSPWPGSVVYTRCEEANAFVGFRCEMDLP